MSSVTFGQKLFKPKPPIKGSFPLDHEGECKEQMLEYLICLKKHQNESSMCKMYSKEYLHCRMNNNLMEKQDLDIFKLDENNEKPSTTSQTTSK